MTLLRVFIRRAETTVAGSSMRALTRFTNGLLKAPTDDRPHVSLGIYLHLARAVKFPIFIRPGGRRVAAPWRITNAQEKYYPMQPATYSQPASRNPPRERIIIVQRIATAPAISPAQRSPGLRQPIILPPP